MNMLPPKTGLFPFSDNIAKAKQSGLPTTEPPTTEPLQDTQTPINPTNPTDQSQAFREYLQLKGYKQSTIAHALKALNDYQTYTQNHPAESYLTHLKQRPNKHQPQKTLRHNTINYHIYCLKLYDHYLHHQNQPRLKLHFLKYRVKPSSIEPLTIEEIKQLFQATQHRPKWVNRDQAVLVCLYHLGLRASEATNLQAQDINWEENWLLIASSKTGHQRQVPINQTAKAILETYAKDINPENPYFIQGLKGKLRPDSLLQILKKLTKTANIQKRVYPHLLRHSIATHLMHNGLDIVQVGRFLGHRWLESTQRYTHIVEEL
jgi:site-specific recombinase XerD